jgi:hypothetical protein
MPLGKAILVCKLQRDPSTVWWTPPPPPSSGAPWSTAGLSPLGYTLVLELAFEDSPFKLAKSKNNNL